MLDKGITASQRILQSVSDTGSRKSKNNLSEVAEHNTSIRWKDLPSVLGPFGQSFSGRWSRIPEPNSSPLPDDVHSDIKLKFDDVNDAPKEYVSETYEIPLAPSTALFYKENSPHVKFFEPCCKSVHKLNVYLRSTKHDVNAGVPGRFLHAVIGPNISGNSY